MDNNERITASKKIEEEYVEVSESRIKYAISEYSQSKIMSGIISTSIATGVSFLTAYVSYPSIDFWKILFLVLTIVSLLALLVSGIIVIIKKGVGHGTKKWLFEEITNSHTLKKPKHINGRKLFIVINILLLIGIPGAIILVFLAVNDWNLLGHDWTPIFFALWIMGTLVYWLFGTFVNAFFAELLFGYIDPYLNGDSR